MTMQQDPGEASAENTFSLSRLPVFDGNRRLWGYELICISAAGVPACATDGTSSVAISLAGSAYMGLQHILQNGKKIMVDFGEKGLLDDLPYALPPASAVVKVAETVASAETVMASLERLKASGFMVAVTNATFDPDREWLYGMADILCISAQGAQREVLASVVAAAERHGAQAMVSRVDDPGGFDICSEMGFSLFSGAFFKAPDVIELRKMSSGEASRFDLLRLVEDPDPDFEALAEKIQTDVSISFRLLAYLNSAAFGFPQKIKSIRQAVAMLGWEKMKHWLRVVLISDMNQNPEASDLTLLAAQRGKFLEQIARDHDFWGFDPGSLHLLGLFSLLDAMLGMAMPEALAPLSLDAKLRSALCGDPASEYGQLLHLARLFEEARWQEADRLVQQLNLDRIRVGEAFRRAVDWAVALTALPHQT
ncbi:MAG: HDOD domain-containing protein [Desulfobacterales bacterium]|nr:HDOD domain-containing protein [Desulfobacterales bacterium]